jgi:hypothetical protein
METKEIAERYFNAMVVGNFDEMARLKMPDCVYWLSGDGSWPFGGYQSRENQAKLWGTVMLSGYISVFYTSIAFKIILIYG